MPKNPEPEMLEAVEEALSPGFHVMVEGSSLGCYSTAEDAKLFGSGHLTPQGIEFTVEHIEA